MNIEFLKKLSEADGIASNEGEVRKVMKEELEGYYDEALYDGLGSLILTKEVNPTYPKVMVCAHMDEVGFIVRSVGENGMLYLMPVGGVKPLAQFLQKVRITTEAGKKIPAIVNGTYKDGNVEELYADIGAYTADEVYALGIEEGNMVTYATEFEAFTLENRYVGKAFDDRLGCFVLGEVLKELKDAELPCNLYMAATSSEEVGIRGAKTAAQLINPDIVFVIDVACHRTEFVRNHTNKKQIDKGPMLMHFDRTLAPNKKLIQYVKDAAKKLNIDLQHDMFKTGGTDGGEAHKVNEGKPTVVTCLPVRYGHCAYSIVSPKDIAEMIALYKEMLLGMDKNVCQALRSFD